MSVQLFRTVGILHLILAAISVFILMGCPPQNLSNNACLQCHDGYKAPDARGFLLGAHASLDCEDCHGDGTEHMQAGGRLGIAIDVPHDADQFALCQQCHSATVTQFLGSAHAVNGGLECSTCHDAHMAETTSVSYEDNSLCLKCHAPFGFDTLEALEEHTAHFPYAPQETAAGRCTGCHMVPLAREEEVFIPTSHDMIPVPPQQTIDQLNAAEIASPNSCLGTAGCHDGSTLAEPDWNLDDIMHNHVLQEVFETIWGE